MKENVCALCCEQYEDSVNKESIRKTGLCESCLDEFMRWEAEGGHL